MSATREFQNAHLINRSIKELYRAFGPEHLRAYPDNFVLGDNFDCIVKDPVLGTQKLAKRIAEHYRLPITTVIVSFSSSLKPPGRVELSNSNELFVELQTQYRTRPKAIAAILAHEVAHIFLHRCGVRFSDEFENEVLTDTTAIYLGFGPTILNDAFESIFGIEHLGYLTLDEFGYILAKRDAVYCVNSGSRVNAGIALMAAMSGRLRYQSEIETRPFTPRPWRKWVIHWFRKLLHLSSPVPKPILFSCACCSQGLRIPATFQNVMVHCPNCHSQFLCYS